MDSYCKDCAMLDEEDDNRLCASCERAKELTTLRAEVESLKHNRTRCPCEFGNPCSKSCSCANSVMSGGCMRCATYGSDEQRANSARIIIEREAEVERLGGFEKRIIESGGCNQVVESGKRRRMTPKEMVDNFKARKYSAGYNAGIHGDITHLKADAEAGRRLKEFLDDEGCVCWVELLNTDASANSGWVKLDEALRAAEPVDKEPAS